MPVNFGGKGEMAMAGMKDVKLTKLAKNAG